MATPTLNGISLDGCENINVDKTANIIPLPIPTSDSDETEVFDLLGVVKTITVTGVFAGTVSSAKDKIDAIEALANGDQSTIDFVSDQTGTISVMVATVTSNWNIPGFTCEYNIRLIQGTD